VLRIIAAKQAAIGLTVSESIGKKQTNKIPNKTAKDGDAPAREIASQKPAQD
jgi:hypothetical protein